MSKLSLFACYHHSHKKQFKRISNQNLNREFSKVAEYVINFQKLTVLAFPCGTGDSNPPANHGDMSSILGPRRFHMPWSN